MTTPAGGTTRVGHPGERLMRIGGWTTAIGMVLTLVAMVPLVVPSVSLPSAFWWLAMVTGLGLVLLLAGVWQAARARGRRITSEVDEVTHRTPSA